jgi:hypothetical protein
MFFLLVFGRPTFILYNDTDKKGKTIQKLSFKKFLMFWLILSGLLVLGLFGYNYKTAT